MKFELIKREPSYFFENIHEDLERFLKETFGEMEPMTVDNKPFLRTFRPAVQIVENDNEYKIDVELTGIKKEDIEVNLTDSSVSIKAEAKYSKEKNEDNLRFTEFKYGTFVRNIPLENEVNTEKSSCEYKNGILHINLIKKEPENKNKGTRLAIN